MLGIELEVITLQRLKLNRRRKDVYVTVISGELKRRSIFVVITPSYLQYGGQLLFFADGICHET